MSDVNPHPPPSHTGPPTLAPSGRPEAPGRSAPSGSPVPSARVAPGRRPVEPPAWTVKARPVVDVLSRILCLVIGGALLVAGLVGLFTGVGQGPLITVLAAGL